LFDAGGPRLRAIIRSLGKLAKITVRILHYEHL
jgi:hypothetical protein